MSKVVCMECDWRGNAWDMLRAVHPFDPTDEVIGCPNCKGIGTLAEACDEPECWEASSMGTPVPGGYRRTCYNHRPKR